jgi:hypothetical protein
MLNGIFSQYCTCYFVDRFCDLRKFAEVFLLIFLAVFFVDHYFRTGQCNIMIKLWTNLTIIDRSNSTIFVR